MTPYEQLRGGMVAQVINHLGDSISIVRRTGERVDLTGFITNDSDTGGTEGLNAQQMLWHMKIDKTPEALAALPNGLADIIRIRCWKLDGFYRPAADTITGEGSAWYCDLQRAPTPPTTADSNIITNDEDGVGADIDK